MIPNRSVDHFNPEYRSQARQGDVLGGVVNLVGTIIGGGTLSLPWAFRRSGVVAGMILLVGSAILCDVSVYFLLSAARRAGGLGSYDEVLSAAFGRPGKLAALWSIAATCWFSIVGYNVLVRQLVAPLVSQYVLGGEALSNVQEIELGSGIVLLMLPATFFRSLHSLRHVSLVQVVAVTGLVVVLCLKGLGCFELPGAASPPPPSLPPSSPAPPSPPSPPHEPPPSPPTPPPFLPPVPPALELFDGDWLEAAPIFVVCFLCSFSAVPIDTELRQPSRTRMLTMVHGSFGLATVLYAFAGIAGDSYSRCTGGDVTSNVLDMFPPTELLANICRFLLALVLLFSLPLLVLPCRAMLHRLLKEHCGGCPSIEVRSGDGRNQSMRAPMLDASAAANGVGNGMGNGHGYQPQLPPIPGSPSPEGARGAGLLPDPSGMANPMAHNVQQPTTSSGLLPMPEERAELSLVYRVVFSSAILTSSLAVAAIVPQVTIVWTVMGSSTTILIAMVFPSFAYIRLRRTPSERASSSVKTRKAVALGIGAFGCVMIPICTFRAVQGIINPSA